jgi:hypothetical protein
MEGKVAHAWRIDSTQNMGRREEIPNIKKYERRDVKKGRKWGRGGGSRRKQSHKQENSKQKIERQRNTPVQFESPPPVVGLPS